MKSRITILGLLVLTVAASSFAQTNPCTAAPGTTTIVNPHTIIIQSPDQSATVLGSTSPAIVSYTMGFFAKGVDPNAGAPVQQQTLNKSAFTLISGTTDCYQYDATQATTVLASYPLGQEFVFAIRANGDPTLGNSAWGAVSAPFGRQAGPRAPKAVIQQ